MSWSCLSLPSSVSPISAPTPLTAVSLSVPSPAWTMRRSSAGFAFSTRTSAWRPVTRMVSPSADTPAESIPGCRRRTPCRARRRRSQVGVHADEPVPVRSPTSTRSGPPPARSSSISSPLMSARAKPTSRLIRALGATAWTVNSSDSAVPDGLQRCRCRSGRRRLSEPSSEAWTAGVVACAEEERVVARAGQHEIGVVARGDQLGAAPADHEVGACAGLDRRRLGIAERAVGLVDADVVRPGARADRDAGEGAAVEAEVGAAGVDLERAGSVGREPQRDACRRRRRR